MSAKAASQSCGTQLAALRHQQLRCRQQTIAHRGRADHTHRFGVEQGDVPVKSFPSDVLMKIRPNQYSPGLQSDGFLNALLTC